MVPLFCQGIFVMKRKGTRKSTGKFKLKWELLPIIFITCILPFVLRMEIISTGLEDMAFLPASMAQRADFFLYWKSRLFVVTGGIMLLVLLDYFFMRKGKDRNWKTWIPLIGYEIFVILSALGSSYSRYAFHGMMEHFETVWVLVGYGIVAYYTYIFVETKKDVQLVMGCLLVSVFFQGMLGLCQMAGNDILNSGFVIDLMIPGKYAQYKDLIVFNFSEEIYQRVSTTLYNTNYAGVYFAMMLPVTLVATVLVKGRRKVIPGVISVIAFICLIGTGSKSAILTFFIMLIFGVILFACIDKKRWYVGVLIGAGMLLLWLGYDSLTGLDTGKRVAESMDFSAREYKLQDIQLQEDAINVVFDGKKITVGWNKIGEALYLDVRDENGAQMKLRDNKKHRRVRLKDSHFKGLRLWCYRKDGIPYLCMEYEGQQWKFTDATEDGTMRYINLWGKADRIEKAESILFNGKEEWFTYRGYIWGRTFPLLKDYIFTGSGPDTFLFVFPQNDYVMRSNMGFGFFSEILSKPHCMYLQMAVQTGVISLILFLVWALIAISDFIKFLRQKGGEPAGNYAAIAVFLSAGSYLLTGIFNDSMIVTAPLFFVLLGLGKKMCKNGLR